MKRKFFDISEICALISYNPVDGSLTWLERLPGKYCKSNGVRSWNARYAGKPALNCKSKNGYLHGSVLGRTLFAHRVCAAIHLGDWPDGEVDHINGDVSDNRADNLRVVSRNINQRNAKMRSDNTSGVTGVGWHIVAQKWYARGKAGGRNMHLGLFDKIEDAKNARMKFNELNGYTKRHGV